MAKMIPSLPMLSESDAERRVFDYLKKLPDTFLCIMNVEWTSGSAGTNGEIDFIVAHPEYPLVFIEVKGGKLACQAERWYRNQELIPESPIQQVLRNAHGFINILKKYSGFPQPTIVPLNWLIALPETSDSNIHVSFDLKPKIITAESFHSQESLTRALDGLKKNQHDTLGSNRFNFISPPYS